MSPSALGRVSPYSNSSLSVFRFKLSALNRVFRRSHSDLDSVVHMRLYGGAQQGDQLEGRSQNMTRAQPAVAAGHIHHYPAGLLDKQGAGRNVPGLEVEFPVGVKTAAGHIGKIQAGCTDEIGRASCRERVKNCAA